MIMIKLFFVRSNVATIHSNNHRSNYSCNQRKRKATLLVSKNSNAKIGKKWKEYQGINAWDGLLDPLDENLRGEILRYGEFVEATYRSFNLNHSSPTYGACKYAKKSILSRSGIREMGYEVTRNLHATCGVQLPSLLIPVKLPSWMLVRSSWIGYVAVCRDRREIWRLGRRDVVIAFRGTVTCLEWLENVRATLTRLNREDDASPGSAGPMVERGFLSLYTSKSGTFKSLQETVRDEVRRIIDSYATEKPLSFTITGHNLGAALAILTANDIDSTFANGRNIVVTVISFGGPRVGDKSFRCHLEKRRTNVLRIVNSDDLVTKVPGFVVNDHDVAADEDVRPVSTGIWRWLQKRVEDTRWLYADVGQELRFSSKECPYLNDVGIATCHELKTYLQLVSGFVSSKCPFRATAGQVLNMYRDK